jgi:hypothetical protein
MTVVAQAVNTKADKASTQPQSRLDDKWVMAVRSRLLDGLDLRGGSIEADLCVNPKGHPTH